MSGLGLPEFSNIMDNHSVTLSMRINPDLPWIWGEGAAKSLTFRLTLLK
jgi:hypothetical protein